MKDEKAIKQRIETLRKQNEHFSAMLQDSKNHSEGLTEFRKSWMISYNSNLKLIELLNWVLS